MGTKLVLEGSSAGAVRAVQDLQKAVEKTDGGFKMTAKSAKALELAAGRIARENEGPQERYNRKVAELAEHVRKGRLSMEQAEVAAKRFSTQLDTAGKTGINAFGPKMVAHLGSFFTQFTGGIGAIAAVTQALRDMEAAADAAGDRRLAAIGPRGEQAQVSGSPAELAAQGALAKDIRRRGIVLDPKAAEVLAFQIRSSGLEPFEQENVLSLAAKGFIQESNVPSVATSAAKYRSSFGAAEAGPIEGVLDKGVAAAKGMASANLATAMAASLVPAQSAASLGISDEETLGALVVLEQSSKDVSIASTQLRSFLDASKLKGIEGDSITQLVDRTRHMIDSSGSSAIKTLGSSEAASGYQTLVDNPEKFREQVDAIRRADEENVATKSADLLLGDNAFQADLMRRRSEGRLAVHEEDRHATRENLMATLRTHYRAKAADHPTHWFTDILVGRLDWADMDDMMLRGALWDEKRGATDKFTPHEESVLEEYLSRSADTLGKIEENQRRPQPQPSGRQE